MDAKEQTRMYRELVLIRSRLFALGCRLYKDENRHFWLLKGASGGRELWLEFERGSWTLGPLGSEQQEPFIWKTILEAIADASRQN